MYKSRNLLKMLQHRYRISELGGVAAWGADGASESGAREEEIGRFW
jgi:hypothetical protein